MAMLNNRMLLIVQFCLNTYFWASDMCTSPVVDGFFNHFFLCVAQEK